MAKTGGIANGVDPDQSARSSLIWVYPVWSDRLSIYFE